MSTKSTDILITARSTVPALRAALEALEPAGLEAAPALEGARASTERDVSAALHEAIAVLESAGDHGAVLFAPDNGPTSLIQSFLAESASGSLEDLRAGGKLNPAPDYGFEATFDNHDVVGWTASLFTWWKRYANKHDFIGPPERPDRRIGNRARIAILGDWGSGRYGAPVSAATIQAASPRYDMLLHLGDVYYSGTPKEVQERFLAFWPEVPGALSRAVNSNHEMYAGGHGYFQQTLPAFEQASSCFAVENDHFLLVGLDSGYDEHDFGRGQGPWLMRLIASAESQGKKLVLFSHHQPYSSIEKQGSKLVDRLRPLLDERRIFAWYWGHEHRCAFYDQHPAWGVHGRLIGHSGFPYFRDKLGHLPLVQANSDGSEWRRVIKDGVPDAVVLDGRNPYVPGEENRYGPNGHLSLELDGPTIIETVHAPDGTVLLTNAIS